jgi:prevent-host-death family protein
MQTPIQISEARKVLGELVNQAYYEGKPIQLVKGSKPMATMIGNREFAEILKVLEEHDPGLADTLAIMSNPEIEALLEEGDENIKQGKGIPLERWLDD